GVCPKPGEERRIRIRVERQIETLFLPMEEEPHLVRFDPGAFVLADVTYKFGARLAAAALQHDSDCVARIRAARELAKDGSRSARDALERALAEESFWGVAAEIADALGGTRAPWALELLTKHAAHSHPKVRRAVAAALGHFRNAEAAEALLPRARDDASYFVRASALHALGRTRDPRAFDVLSDGIATHSWNGVIESGAARGLGELADERATPLLLEAAKLGHEESLRRAAIDGLARLAALVESQRRTIVDALGGYLDDPMFLVQLSAVAAAERLEDIRLVEPLTRLGESAFDGRVRRNAADAAIRIREGQRVPSQVSALRSELDTLREEYRKLEGKLDEISTHR
ncbi:MAG: HEAT repeat domain-containing protein, partial [Candidatus Eremiobacteraeota bacterium]|nr:HEAT repeat domain-containing protein [Candidatus Eremiobacteraeota bacterium]